MSQLLSTVLLIVVLGLVAHLSSWAIAGGLLAVNSGVGTGLWFAGGQGSARVVQAILGGGALLALVEGILREFKLSRATYYILILAGSALVIGTLLSMWGRWSLRRRRRPSPAEAQEPPSQWRRFVTAFGLTLVSPRQWLFTAAVVSSIGGLGPGWLRGFGLFILYVLLSDWLTLGLVGIRVAMPGRYDEVAEQVEEGWRQHGTHIVAYILAVIGFGMIGAGFAALWG